jgi:UDP-N-acetylmuramoylalanine--D-glutamate ligase
MKNWNGKHILIIGVARQGTALARYLTRHGAVVVLNDHRTRPDMDNVIASLLDVPVKWALGEHPLTLLEDVDLVCPSGGVPLELPIVAEAIRRGIPLSNDSQIFLEACPCPVIGITGSAGKTTTTTLVGRMAQAASQRVGESAVSEMRNTQYAIHTTFVGGNIGNPLISVLEEITVNDLAVMELSSFQLAIMTRSPHVGAVLNVTPNHLDRHPSMEAYTSAKSNILAFQGAGDVAVLGREDAGAWSLVKKVKGKLITFGQEEVRDLSPRPSMSDAERPRSGQALGLVADVHLRGDEIVIWDGQRAETVLARSEILLRGEHNLLNVLAACAISFAAGLPVEAMRAGVQEFRGVPHRLEFIRSLNGADWYNDSIATAPERAIAGMRAFDGPLVLLAGGYDKKLPWEDFARVVCERVDHLVLFGASAAMITEKVQAVRKARPFTIDCCAGLYEAVQAAANMAWEGDVVLLSPGGASFDEFRDFEVRGERFKQWVLALA